ncbi:hypothetical protein [Hymenobacter armeniacus]|uniref:Filamentous hemagglutinin N-terminal domain-containing protein n=1 Tax=Hymenobacter armeniacus TaxID=2771358 RepID=A0ABR8JNR8_9BACT|nr:hypothetical protein [Hymenobacter armeniacus]MBD2721635.1 hypothetical protein [Hymenobacter armeniacus]
MKTPLILLAGLPHATIRRARFLVAALGLATAAQAQNVGINTTTPDRPLTVQGTGTNSELLSLRNTAGAPRFHVNLLNNGLNLAETGSANASLFIQPGGKVGLGTSTPRGSLDVANGDTYLVANPNNGTSQNLYLPGHIFLAPYNGTSGTAYLQARVPNMTSTTSIGLTLRTTNAGIMTDAVQIASNGNVALANNLRVATTLNVTGDATLANNATVGNNLRVSKNLRVVGDATVSNNLDVAGSVGVGFITVNNTASVRGNTHGEWRITCPAGTQVLSGGGGHRDYNRAQRDIVLNYSGPDPASPTTGWMLRFTNTSGSNRAVMIYCNCARIR